MVVQNINSASEFFSLLKDKHYKYTVVDYTAKWCGPCQQIKPYYEDLSKHFPEIQFLRVDVDELADVAYWANVRAMPTFCIYKAGLKVNESIGANLANLLDVVKIYA